LIRGRGKWMFKRGFASLTLSFGIFLLDRWERGKNIRRGATPLSNLYSPFPY